MGHLLRSERPQSRRQVAAAFKPAATPALVSLLLVSGAIGIAAHAHAEEEPVLAQPAAVAEGTKPANAPAFKTAQRQSAQRQPAQRQPAQRQPAQRQPAQRQPVKATAAAPKVRKPELPVSERIAAVFTPAGWPAAKRRANHVFSALGPVGIPGLSQDRFTFNFEFLVSSARPTDITTGAPLAERSFSYAARWLVEAPIVDRAWFLGLMHDVAAASVPSGTTAGTGGSTLVLGNPEVWLRGLWTSELGLSAGGGVGVVIPVPREFSTLESEVVRAIRVVQADNYSHYRDLTMTFRPFLDVRHVVGPLVFQARQGLDVGVVTRSRRPGENRYDLTAITQLYAGVTAFKKLTFGLEVQEVYQLTASVDSDQCAAPCDERRAQLSISPSIRLKTPRLSPSISMIVPVSTPLREEVASFIAARVNMHVAF